MTITKTLVVPLTPFSAIIPHQYGSFFLTGSSTDKTQAILPPRPTPSAFKQLSHHPRSPNTLMLTAGTITSPPSNLGSRSLAIHQSLTAYGPESSELTVNPAKAFAAEAGKEEDVDLFGSDGEEEDTEAARIREERLAEYKKEGKTKPAAKFIVIGREALG